MRVNLRRFEFAEQWLLRFSCEDTIFKSFAFLIHSEEKIDIIEKNGSEQNAICGLLIDEAFLKFLCKSAPTNLLTPARCRERQSP